MIVTKQSRNKRVSMVVALFALVVCALLAFTLYLRYRGVRPTASEYNGPATPLISVQSLKKLGRYVGSDYNLSLVRFDTDFERQPTGIAPIDQAAGRNVGLPTNRPSTRILRTMDQTGLTSESIHVQGELTEVQRLNGRSGELGRVDRSIPFRQDHGGDDAARRLGVFLQTEADRPSLLLLAAAPAGEEIGLSEGEFLGPLADQDVPLVAELVATLKAEPYGQLRRERAESLLGSHNPWLVWLGLARLDDLKVVTKDDFERVLQSRPVEDAPMILSDMQAALSLTGKNAELTQGVIDALRLPDRQQAVLECYVNNPSLLTNMPEYREVRKAAKEYRESITDQPDKQEVRRLLDSLLAVKRRVFAPDGKIITEDEGQ